MIPSPVDRPSSWLALALLMVLAAPAYAHDLVSGVGTQSFLRFPRGKIQVTLNFGVATDRGAHYLRIMDFNDDERVTQEERDAWLERIGDELVAELSVHVNGRPLSFEITERTALGIIGRVMNVQFDTYFVMEAELPGQIEGGGWWLHFEDRTFTDQKSSQFVCPVYGTRAKEPMVSYIIFEPSEGEFVEEVEWHQIPGRKAVLFLSDSFRWMPGQVEVPSIQELAGLALTDHTEGTEKAEVVVQDGTTETTEEVVEPVEADEVQAEPFFTESHLWVGIAVVVIGAFLSLRMRKAS